MQPEPTQAEVEKMHCFALSLESDRKNSICLYSEILRKGVILTSKNFSLLRNWYGILTLSNSRNYILEK